MDIQLGETNSNKNICEDSSILSPKQDLMNLEEEKSFQGLSSEKSQSGFDEENSVDEYPIIWYEQDIDSEEKKAFKALIQEKNEINLFSEFEEAFQFAQCLGSFLLITLAEVDEEKLLQDFEALEDTYGRRYFDFEEKAVLLSLFQEISEDRIKSLKVYAFFTRFDFFNEIFGNKGEEDIMIMCDIKEMADQFQEEFAIFWCDPDLSLESKEGLINKLDIEEKNIYKDFDDLLKKLDDETGHPYHLILSGKLNIEMIIEKIDDFKDLLCLYVYDRTPLFVNGKKSRKIQMEKTLEGLIPKIIEGVRTNLKYKSTFPAFASQFDDWDKSHINKVHYYLRGLRNFRNRGQAKRDFINLAKRIYQSKKLLEFEREYDEYEKKQILKWYAAQSPIYKLVNNCLRLSTLDSITYCRFILKDLERAIKEEYQQESKRFHGVVYRGAHFSKDEFEKLETNIGKEIEMYGFLSTTKNLKTAQKFLNGDIANKVLITIIIPSFPLPELDEQGFADMRRFSRFSAEEEILFNVRSRFQILNVGSTKQGNKEYRHLVLLYGAQLLRQCMTIENPTTDLKLKLPLELKCHSCDSKKDLFAYKEETGKTQMVCRECFIKIGFATKSTFLLPVDEKTEEKRIEIEVPGRISEFGTEAKLAYVKTFQCHQCLKFSESQSYRWINLENGDIVTECLECFLKNEGNKLNHLLLSEEDAHVFWNTKQGEWEKAYLDFKAKELKELVWDIGSCVFDQAGDDNTCQEFYRLSLKSLARKARREEMKTISYLYLGNSSNNLGETGKALEYNLKVLGIRKFIYGETHQETATSYSTLASTYFKSGDFRKAIEYELKALEINKSINGETNPETAKSYDDLALMYDNYRDSQKALEYQLKGLDLAKSIHGGIHPSTAISYDNLAQIYDGLGDYQKALEYYQEAFDIRKSVFGEKHLQTAASYNNLGLVYYHRKDFQRALNYQLKALEINKSLHAKKHPSIANSYHNLAMVYTGLEDYQKALKYYLKALEIKQSPSQERHPKTATSYEALASVYDHLKEKQKAIECYQKALDIKKLAFGETHVEIATSYDHFGGFYDSLQEYDKAFEYRQKALEIRKAIYGERHAETASSYFKLGMVCVNLGDHGKALGYHLDSLKIKMLVYGEIHTETALSYNILGFVYNDLEDYDKALECHQKALEIRKSLWGETHKNTAVSYENLASAYKMLGNPQKALDCYLKGLHIRKSLDEETDEETAILYEDLAAVYENLGEKQKTLECHLEAFKIKILIYGESHVETAMSLNTLARVYDSLKDYKKALECHQKAFHIRKAIWGETDRKMIISYENLAFGYERLDADQKALEYYLKALDIKKSASGETNAETATSFDKLGEVYERLGDDEEALEYHQKALRIRKIVFGEIHVETATSYFKLGMICVNLGDNGKALEYHLDSLKIKILVYGEIHTETALSYNILGFVYNDLEDNKKALECHQKALEIRKSLWGELHINTAISYGNLASGFEMLQDHQKALECYLQSLNIRKSLDEETDEETAILYEDLAAVYENLGDKQKTIECQLKAMNIQKILSEGGLCLTGSNFVSEISSDEESQSSVSQEPIEIEESRKDSEVKDCRIVDPLKSLGISEVLGKRSPSRNDDEEIFEPDIEKKFKQ